MAKSGKLNVKTLQVEERPIRSRHYIQYILIACEDETTEPKYFETFQTLFDNLLPMNTMYVKSVGTGKNSIGVVQQALIEKTNIEAQIGKTIDDVWAVFDKDDLDLVQKNAERFQQAFDFGKDNDVKIAYSNECFELWLLLHFQGVDAKSPIPRTDLYSMLEAHVKQHEVDFVYEHGKIGVLPKVAKYGNEQRAISRAQALAAYHAQNQTHAIEANPNTLVYQLVSHLRELYAWYSYKA